MSAAAWTTTSCVKVGGASAGAVALAVKQIVVADPLAGLCFATQHDPALAVLVGDDALLKDAAGDDAIDRGDRRVLGKEFAARVQLDHVHRAAQRVFHLVGRQTPADQELHNFRHGGGIGNGGFDHELEGDYSCVLSVSAERRFMPGTATNSSSEAARILSRSPPK